MVGWVELHLIHIATYQPSQGFCAPGEEELPKENRSRVGHTKVFCLISDTTRNAGRSRNKSSHTNARGLEEPGSGLEFNWMPNRRGLTFCALLVKGFGHLEGQSSSPPIFF